MMDMKDKVVVITGGATGIGFALAKQFGAEGAKLVLAEPREHRLKEACEALSSDGIDARWYVCDVAQLESVEALADFVWREHARCDVLINNAGVAQKPGRLPKVDMAEARRVMDVNFFGVWHGCAVFGPRMASQDTPSMIYNTGSENSFFCAMPGAAAYIASKHAVLGLTENFREDMPDHVTVGTIFPGWVASELNPPEVNQYAMDTDEFAAIIYPQIRAGERFVVSHAYNRVRIRERIDAVEAAFETHAPRYDGDEEYDVRTVIARMRG
ncbi:SDR family oxidoreductase [Henriciella sp.]|uniref:SDR family NAD(P)-dependent oxidoreductase n=1 Tax=Henriciella sp. TaxID=1968823 RepID=UPI0026030444|nr:SDR family oxidoreductase [Henriciella sp.]